MALGFGFNLGISGRSLGPTIGQRFAGSSMLLGTTALDNRGSGVIRVGRSTDDAEQDFDVSQVSGSGLLNFVVPADVQALYNDAMNFDGANDYVRFTAVAELTKDAAFSVRCYFFVRDVDSAQMVFNQTLSSADRVGAYIVDGALRAGVYNGSSYFAVASTPINTLEAGTIYKLEIAFDGSTTLTTELNDVAYTETDTPVVLNTGHLDIGAGSGRYLDGSVWDFEVFDDATFSNSVFQVDGDGNAAGNWEDNTGSNDGTVHGSPAVFTGQDFDGAVTIEYDQRVSTANDVVSFPSVPGVCVDTGVAITGASTFRITGKMRAYGSGRFGGDFDGDADKRVMFVGLDDAGKFMCLTNNDGGGGGNSIYVFDTADLTDGAEHTFDLSYTDAGSGALALILDGVTISTGSGDIADSLFAGSAQNFRFGSTSASRNGSPAVTAYDCTIQIDGGVTHTYSCRGNKASDFIDTTGGSDGVLIGDVGRADINDIEVKANDAIQTTAADQPLIVKDGVAVTLGWKPALDFNGTSHNLGVDDAFDFDTEVSVFAVFKCDESDLSANQYIAGPYDAGSNDRGFSLLLRDDEELAVNFGNPADGSFAGTWNSTTPIDADALNIAGFTFSSGTVQLYINGATLAGEQSGGTVPSSLRNTSAPFNIGSTSTPNGYFNGQIAAVVVFDRALGSAEAVSLMDELNKTYGTY